MAYDPNNVFARILRGELPLTKVYESEHALAFQNIHPEAPVHVLVIPKGNYTSFDDFSANASETEIVDFTRAIGKVGEMAGVKESGYRLISNHGPDSMGEVPHYHVHILGGKPLGTKLA